MKCILSFQLSKTNFKKLTSISFKYNLLTKVIPELINCRNLSNLINNSSKYYSTRNFNSSISNNFSRLKSCKFTRNKIGIYKSEKKFFSTPLSFIIKNYKTISTFEEFLNIFETNFKNYIPENFYEVEANHLKDEKSKSLSNISEIIEFWHHSIFAINNLLCSKILLKEDLVKMLSFLNFFQPKTYKQFYITKELKNPYYSEEFSTPHKNEFLSIKRPSDPFFGFMLHIRTYTSNALFAFIRSLTKKEEEKEDEFKIDSSLNDLLEEYSIFFENLEKKFIDDVHYGRVDYSFEDCVYLMQSFGIAKEGTNLFFEVLMRKISKNFVPFVKANDIQFSPQLKKQLIQVIINYLPHELFNINKQGVVLHSNNQDGFIEEGMTENVLFFYDSLFSYIIEKISDYDNDYFLNIMQGLFRIPFISDDIVKTFIMSFNERILSNINSEEKMPASDANGDSKILTKEYFFKYLEIITYFLRIENNLEKFISLVLEQINLLENKFIDVYLKKFSMKEIATIFWVYYNLNIVNESLISKFEERIYNLVNMLLIELDKIEKEVGKMSSKERKGMSGKPYIINSNRKNEGQEIVIIDNYDIEAIIFFTNKYSFHPVIRFLKKALITLKTNNN